jgi:hypothetical protein
MTVSSRSTPPVITRLTSDPTHPCLFGFLPDDQLVVTRKVKEVVSIQCRARVIEGEFFSNRVERPESVSEGRQGKQRIRSVGERESTISNPDPWTGNPVECPGGVCRNRSPDFCDLGRGPQTSAATPRGEMPPWWPGRPRWIISGRSRTVDLGYRLVTRVARTAERRRPFMEEMSRRLRDRGDQSQKLRG